MNIDYTLQIPLSKRLFVSPCTCCSWHEKLRQSTTFRILNSQIPPSCLLSSVPTWILIPTKSRLVDLIPHDFHELTTSLPLSQNLLGFKRQFYPNSNSIYICIILSLKANSVRYNYVDIWKINNILLVTVVRSKIVAISMHSVWMVGDF